MGGTAACPAAISSGCPGSREGPPSQGRGSRSRHRVSRGWGPRTPAPARLAGRPGQQGPGGRGPGSRHPLPGGSASRVTSPVRRASRSVGLPALPPLRLRPVGAARSRQADGARRGSARARLSSAAGPGSSPASAPRSAPTGRRPSVPGTGDASVHAKGHTHLSLCCGLRLRQVFPVFSETHLMAPLFLFQTAYKGL